MLFLWTTLYAVMGLLPLSFAAAAAAKSLQSYLTLCDPIDGGPPGSPIPGILQARVLEWVAISFSNAWKWKVKVKSLSRVQLLATPWTAAHQAPPPMGFSRQEYWSGVQIWSTIRKLCFKGSQCGRLVWFILESSGSSWALKMTGVWICSGVGTWMWRVWVAVRWFPRK